MKLGHLTPSTALLFACVIATTSARAAGPAAGFNLSEYSDKSPDGKTVVEQYNKDDAEKGYMYWEFWVRRGDTQTLLNKDEDAEYPADFRFTNDSRWLVRSQKTGSGEASLYLYRQSGDGFISATKKPIGDLAWAYFKSRPESKKARTPDFHISAGLLKGTDENYRFMGVNWPENRYIVISLWGELEPNAHHHQLFAVRGWHVRYDLETGKFDVPPEFRDDNAEALDRRGERSP
jgi:hypothetical protein